MLIFLISIGICVCFIIKRINEEAKACAIKQLEKDLTLGKEFKKNILHSARTLYKSNCETINKDMLKNYIYFNCKKVFKKQELIAIYDFTQDLNIFDEIIENTIETLLKDSQKEKIPAIETVKSLFKNGIFESQISLTKINKFVKNILDKKISLVWRKDNTLRKIIYANTEHVFPKGYNHSFFENIINISIYKINDDNTTNFYIKNNEFIADIPSDISNIHTSIYVEHWDVPQTDTISSTPYSVLIYKEYDLFLQFSVEETNKKIPYSNSINYHTIFIKENQNEPVIIDKVTSFYINEIYTKENHNLYNGTYQLKLPIIWKNNFVIINQTEKNKDNLLVYNNKKIIHFIENIDPYFSLSKKANNEGQVLCERIDKFKNKKLLRLNADSTIDVLYEGVPKYENIHSFLSDIPQELDFDLIDDENYVVINYFQKECLNFYILYEYTKNADKKEIIENKFSDDMTINYRVFYKKNRILDIIFVYYLLNSRWGAENAFDNNLYGQKYKNNHFAGTAIYMIPFLDYYKGLKGDFAYINAVSQHYLNEEQRNNFVSFVQNIFKNYNLLYVDYKLPKKFIQNNIAADLLLDKLTKFISTQSEYRIDYRTMQIYDVANNLVLDCKKLKNDIKSNLITSNKYKTKWKSEVELYNLVMQFYPNSVYQYRSKFLEYQSFDIYIPDLKIAIEYQGEQHYYPIELFGGIEGLNKRKLLDEKKRKICKKQGIKLIEWKYTVPINQLSLKKYIKDVLDNSKGNF